MVQLAARQVLALEIEVRVLVGEPIVCFLSVLYFLIFPCLLVAQDDSDWWQGPVELANQYPLALLHTNMEPDRASVPAAGSLLLDSNLSWSNTLSGKKHAYRIDAETRVLTGQLEYSHTDDMAVEIALPLVWRGGGVLDSFIDHWHQAFGLPRGNRPDVEDDRYLLAGDNTDGSEFELKERGASLGDITLSTQHVLSAWSDEEHKWAISPSLRLPTARDSFGQDAIDIGLEVLGEASNGQLNLYWGGGYVLFLDNYEQGLRYQSNHFAGFSTFEYLLSDSWGASLGLVAYSALLKDVEYHPNYSLYLDFGLKHKLSDMHALELLLRENPGPDEGTTDVTFYFGLKSKLLPLAKGSDAP